MEVYFNVYELLNVIVCMIKNIEYIEIFFWGGEEWEFCICVLMIYVWLRLWLFVFRGWGFSSWMR